MWLKRQQKTFQLPLPFFTSNSARIRQYVWLSRTFFFSNEILLMFGFQAIKRKTRETHLFKQSDEREREKTLNEQMSRVEEYRRKEIDNGY